MHCNNIFLIILFLTNFPFLQAKVTDGLRTNIKYEMTTDDQKTDFSIDIIIDENNRSKVIPSLFKRRFFGVFNKTRMNLDDHPETQINDRSMELNIISNYISSQAPNLSYQTKEILIPKKLSIKRSDESDSGVSIDTNEYIETRINEIENEFIRNIFDNFTEFVALSTLSHKSSFPVVLKNKINLLRRTYIYDGMLKVPHYKHPHFVNSIYSKEGKIIRSLVNKCILDPRCNINDLTPKLVLMEVVGLSFDYIHINFDFLKNDLNAIDILLSNNEKLNLWFTNLKSTLSNGYSLDELHSNIINQYMLESQLANSFINYFNLMGDF